MIAASHAQMYNVMLQILGVLQSSIRILLIRNGVDAIQAVMLQVLAVFFICSLSINIVDYSNRGKQTPWYTSYPFDIVVHGGWSEWSSYTDCSKTCDEGTKSRSRTCTRPVPSSGGSECDGNASETMNCELKECVTGT